MGLKRVIDIIEPLKSVHKAVKCFECINLEQVQWSIEAAEKEEIPVIIMLYYDMTFYTDMDVFLSFATRLAEKAAVPVGVTYVYPDSMQLVAEAIKQGFASICFNSAETDMQKRIIETRKVAELCHLMGVDVTANPGDFCSADEVIDFVKNTGIDAVIAPVICECEGNNHNYTENQHWFKDNKEYIDFAKLEAINKGIAVPIVLHHSYNVPINEIKESTGFGVSQVNDGCPFDTALYESIKSGVEDPDSGLSFIAVMLTAKEKMASYISEGIRSLW